MKNNIYIFSQPVHSGKTTLLMQWIHMQPNAGGILTPDINGKRRLYDVELKTFTRLEVDETHHDHVNIGKYYFDNTAFAQAQEILLRAKTTHFDWVIADEIGKLELQQKKGLEPAVSELIKYYQQKEINGKLLLVIRDYLLLDCINEYGLKNAITLNKEFFL